MFCRFEILDGVATCLDCGNPIPTRQTDSAKVFRRCAKPSGKWKPPEKKPPPEAAIPCIHRGAELRRMEGTLCGMKGSLFPVFQCGAFGECTATRICPKSTIKAVCSTCEKRA